MAIDDAGVTAGPPASLSPEEAAEPAHPPRPSVRTLEWRGPWRVAVDETSMAPTLEPGDWLLVDPTVRRWPRRGSIVVVREPGSDVLVIKRVAGRSGDPVDVGPVGAFDRAGDSPIVDRPRLGPDEAWLVGDATGSHDSRHYGPVTLDRLVARAWFRYGPLDRIGRLR